MKVAFEGIGSLSKTTINHLREIKKKEVDALMADRQRRVRHEHTESKWDTAEKGAQP